MKISDQMDSHDNVWTLTVIPLVLGYFIPNFETSNKYIAFIVLFILLGITLEIVSKCLDKISAEHKSLAEELESKYMKLYRKERYILGQYDELWDKISSMESTNEEITKLKDMVDLQLHKKIEFDKENGY